MSEDRPVQVVFVPVWVAVCAHLNGTSLSPAEARFLVSGRYQGQPPRSLSLAPMPSRTSRLGRRRHLAGGLTRRAADSHGFAALAADAHG